MKNLGTQLSLGAWAAIAVGMGILGRSWETFFSLMAICAFFSFGAAASAALRTKRPAIRLVGVVGTVAFLGVILGGLLSGLERLYLVNGASYPAWLAKADLGPVNGLDDLLFVGSAANDGRGLNVNDAAACRGKSAELHHKSGGVVVIRCGGLMWYDSTTYLAHMGGKR